MSASLIKVLGASGGVFVRQHIFAKAGDHHNGHLHRVNHVTLVQRGAVRCEVAGHPALELRAPAWITIDKGTHHKFTAIEDDTCYFCIFSVYGPDGELLHAVRDDAVLGLNPGCEDCELNGRC